MSSSKKWLITAGPTLEDIDPMRFLSNRSSGRMGYEIASQAMLRGHDVTLISGPTAIAPPTGTKVINVRSAADMFIAVKEEFYNCDIAVMAAAVADYTPAKMSPTKLPKGSGELSLVLKRTQDILAYIGALKKGRVLVGFALETPAHKELNNNSNNELGITSSMRTRAADKLRAKNVDFAVLNNAVAAGASLSEISVLDTRHEKWRDFYSAPKQEHARNLVEIFEQAL